jgi:hypothetical protein
VAAGRPFKRTRQERRSDHQHILYALVALVRQISVSGDYRNDSRQINSMKPQISWGFA